MSSGWTAQPALVRWWWTRPGRLWRRARRNTAATPRPGWTEQNPQDWWEGATVALRGPQPRRAARSGLGLTGQMHGSVFLDSPMT
ncbi:MAG: hypothetical protein WKH64_05935 [Chloroflexia bacterium]